MQIRQEKALPVLDEYFRWGEGFDPQHIIKGKFRDGIVYSGIRRKHSGHSCLTAGSSAATNAAEAGRFVISRKNFLFCARPLPSKKSDSNCFQLIETAKANRLDPFKYLVYICSCHRMKTMTWAADAMDGEAVATSTCRTDSCE